MLRLSRSFLAQGSGVFITASSRRMRNRTSCLRMRSSAEALVTSSSAQGKEMARRKELAALTGPHVYFADPHAPGSAGPTRTPTACCAFDYLFIRPDPLDLQWHTRPCPPPWEGWDP
jgi:hypothetical protein